MSQSYDLSYEVPLDLLRRAMVSWAQPHLTWQKRLVRWIMIIGAGVALGVVLAVSRIYDYVSSQVLTGMLIGFYAGMAFWLFTHKRAVKRLSAFTATQLEKQGKTHAKFTAEAIEFKSDTGSTRSNWKAFDQVILMADATALRSGAMVYPIPHSALPDDVDPAAFHADLERWQEAAK